MSIISATTSFAPRPPGEIGPCRKCGRPRAWVRCGGGWERKCRECRREYDRERYKRAHTPVRPPAAVRDPTPEQIAERAAEIRAENLVRLANSGGGHPDKPRPRQVYTVISYYDAVKWDRKES